MKKISAAAVFILCFILSACAFSAGVRDDIPPYGQSSDGCIYFRDDELIKRLDPEGGRVSVVCPDPVCGHSDEGCTAYGKTQLAVCGDTLYFVSNGSAHPASGSILHMYDLAAGEDKIIYRSDGEVRYPREAYGRVYFTESIIEVDEDDEGGVTFEAGSWNVMRYDIDGGKIERLNWEPVDSFLVLEDVRDGRLYFSSGGVDGCFSTDADFRDKRSETAGSFTVDGDEISIIYDHPGIDPVTGEPYGGKYYCLLRTDGESGEVAELFANGYSVQHFPALGGYLFTVGTTREDANELVFVTYDGEKRSVYKTEGDMIFSSGLASAEPGCDYHTDEYTFIRCHHKADETADEHGNISVQRDHILIVNVKTGDCRMAEL